MALAAPLVAFAQIAALGTAAPPGQLHDAVVLGPKWADAPAMRVAPLEVELDCRGQPAAPGDDAACAFAVRLRLTSRDAHPVAGAFWVGAARDVRVLVDGEPAAEPRVLPAELERFEAGTFRGPSFVRPGDSDVERTVAFVVPGVGHAGGPGEPHEVVLRGRVRLVPFERSLPDRIVASDASLARHPLFGTSAPRKAAGLVVVAPVRGIDAQRTPEGLLHYGIVTTHAPRSWTVEGRGDRACPAAVTGLDACGAPDVMEREDGVDRVRIAMASPLGTHLVLGARAETPPGPAVLTHGGPSLGAGYAFGLRDGLRLRAAYDAGLGRSGAFLGSLAVETDASRRLEAVPMVLVGSDAALLRPSFGVGFGVPVSMLPDVGVSARLRLDVKWTGVGLAADVDMNAVPKLGVTGAILAEVGL